MVQLRLERLLVLQELRGDRPVLFLLERPNLLFPLTDESQRDGLHAPRRQSRPDRTPEKGADLVSDQPIENASSLLSLDLLEIEFTRCLQGPLYGPLRDLPERDTPEALRLLLVAELLCHVVGDRLTFTVRIRREDDRVLVLRSFLQVGDDLPLPPDRDVLRLEAMIHIDTEFLGGKVTDVAHRGGDFIVVAQVLADGPCLGRRLDDDEVLFTHSASILVPAFSRISRIRDVTSSTEWPFVSTLRSADPYASRRKSSRRRASFSASEPPRSGRYTESAFTRRTASSASTSSHIDIVPAGSSASLPS